MKKLSLARKSVRDYAAHMSNFQTMIQEILGRGVTLLEIARECGFASPGAVHDLKSGQQQTTSYERGEKLRHMHRRVMRRKVPVA